MSHVFISYKHGGDDANFAKQLKMRIESAGFEAWSDTELEGGTDWGDEIDRAIDEAFAVIVIMSPAARGSEYITYEWSYALGWGKTVLPIVVQQTELHPKLARKQYIDCSARFAEPWDAVIERIAELKEAYDAAYVDQLVKNLSDADRYIRLGAVQSLRYEDQVGEHLPALLKMLTDDDWEVRLEIAQILGERGDASIVADLVNALHEEQREEVQAHIANAIANLGDVPASSFPKLLEFAEKSGPTYGMLWDVMIKLGDIAVPHLIEALKVEDGETRIFVARALGSIGNTAAIPALISMLEDSDFEVRFDAVGALRQLGDPAVPGLIEALRNENKNVRIAAAEALPGMEIVDADHIDVLLNALCDSNPKVQDPIIGTLIQMGASVVPGLIAALDDAESDVKEAIAFILGEIADPSAVDCLIPLLADNTKSFWHSPERVCTIAAKALYMIGTSDALEAVKKWRLEQEPY